MILCGVPGAMPEMHRASVEVENAARRRGLIVIEEGLKTHATPPPMPADLSFLRIDKPVPLVKFSNAELPPGRSQVSEMRATSAESSHRDSERLSSLLLIDRAL